jgi:hypothetical protein
VVAREHPERAKEATRADIATENTVEDARFMGQIILVI